MVFAITVSRSLNRVSGHRRTNVVSARGYCAPKVSIEAVKDLRYRTQAGYTDCKKALLANDNDITKAVAWLKEQGIIKAAKKHGRAAAEGAVAVSLLAPNQTMFVELNCETDFAARSTKFIDGFQSINAELQKYASSHFPSANNLLSNELSLCGNADLAKLSLIEAETYTADPDVLQHVQDLGAVLQENVSLRRLHFLSGTDSLVENTVNGIYVHQPLFKATEGIPMAFGRIGAGISLSSSTVSLKDSKYLTELQTFANQLAIQVASSSPSSLREAQDSTDVLYQMDFVFEPGKSISQVVKKFGKRIQVKDLEISAYLRLACGEGIEVKEADFAEEVMSMAQK